MLYFIYGINNFKYFGINYIRNNKYYITYNKGKWIKFIISFVCCIAFLYLIVEMAYNKNSITKVYTIDDGNKVEPYIESIEDKIISYNYKDNVLTVVEISEIK